MGRKQDRANAQAAKLSEARAILANPQATPEQKFAARVALRPVEYVPDDAVPEQTPEVAMAMANAAGNTPEWQAVVNAYNTGGEIPDNYIPLLDQMNQYYQQGQAAPGNLKPEVANQALTQWGVDTTPGGLDKFMQMALPIAAGILTGGAGFGALGLTAGGAVAGATSAGMKGGSLGDIVKGGVTGGALAYGAGQLSSLIGGAPGVAGAAGGTTGDIAAMLQELNPSLTAGEAMAAAEAYASAGYSAATLGPAITQQAMLNASGIVGSTGNAALDQQLASAVQNGTMPIDAANSYVQAVQSGTVSAADLANGLNQTNGVNQTNGLNHQSPTIDPNKLVEDSVYNAASATPALNTLDSLLNNPASDAVISGALSLLGADMAAESARESSALQTQKANEAISGMNSALATGQAEQRTQFDAGNEIAVDQFNRANALQTELYNTGRNTLDTQFNTGQNLQRPWYESGTKALSSLNDLMGLGSNGPEAQLASLMSAPGYKFRLQQGQKGLDAGLAARGGMGSGKSAVAASQYNQNFASNEYGNRLAQLSSLSNTGLQTGTNMANQGMDYAKTSANRGTDYANTLSSLGTDFANRRADRGSTFANNFAAQGNQTASNNANILTGLGNAQGAAAIAQGNAWQSGLLGAGAAAGSYLNPPKAGGKWVNGVWVPA